jgi:hypothetical protein
MVEGRIRKSVAGISEVLLSLRRHWFSQLKNKGCVGWDGWHFGFKLLHTRHCNVQQ